MIEVLRAGLYDTIQDLGRPGVQQYGVPLSGAMDQSSAKLANGLLGNSPSEAVIEMTMLGPTLKFHKTTVICITGANAAIQLNTITIKTNEVVRVHQGDILNIKSLNDGARAYLSVLGGFKTPLVMGSRSQCRHITSEFKLSKGSLVEYDELYDKYDIAENASKIKRQQFLESQLEVYLGPEFLLLDDKAKKMLFETEFVVSAKSNRMAYQFHDVFLKHNHEMLTSLVRPGTVQLTPSGKLIVLMRDAQTTGGYPRVLQLSETSINLLSQKTANRIVKFKQSKTTGF